MRSNPNQLRVCYVGGGTGGHIFPLFSVDAAIRELCGSHDLEYSCYLITGRTVAGKEPGPNGAH